MPDPNPNQRFATLIDPFEDLQGYDIQKKQNYIFHLIIELNLYLGNLWTFEGRWVAKLVARRLVTAALWVLTSNPDMSQKYKMGDISKEVANTL